LSEQPAAERGAQSCAPRGSGTAGAPERRKACPVMSRLRKVNIKLETIALMEAKIEKRPEGRLPVIGALNARYL
jgi:hypothetical protein